MTHSLSSPLSADNITHITSTCSYNLPPATHLQALLQLRTWRREPGVHLLFKGPYQRRDLFFDGRHHLRSKNAGDACLAVDELCLLYSVSNRIQ